MAAEAYEYSRGAFLAILSRGAIQEMLAQTAPILAELSAVERVLARERTAHAETRDALQHANLRAREARTALAAEASTGVLQLVRKAVVDATKGSSSAQQRLDQLYLILPPRELSLIHI